MQWSRSDVYKDMFVVLNCRNKTRLIRLFLKRIYLVVSVRKYKTKQLGTNASYAWFNNWTTALPKMKSIEFLQIKSTKQCHHESIYYHWNIVVAITECVLNWCKHYWLKLCRNIIVTHLKLNNFDDNSNYPDTMTSDSSEMKQTIHAFK